MADTSHGLLRAQLQEERERLRDQLRKLGQGPDRNLSFDEGFADSSQVTAERAEIEALAVTLSDTLDDIEAALEKFDEGTYGRCEGCGGPIAEAAAGGDARRPPLHRLRVEVAFSACPSARRSSSSGASSSPSSCTRSATGWSPTGSGTTPPSGPVASP